MTSPSNNMPDNPDENSFEGPDVEIPVDAPEPDGLGTDGTIPHHPGGVAAGHTGGASRFEPHEDAEG